MKLNHINLNLNLHWLLPFFSIYIYFTAFILTEGFLTYIVFSIILFFSIIFRLFCFASYQIHFLVIYAWVFLDFFTRSYIFSFNPKLFPIISIEDSLFYLTMIIIIHELIIMFSNLLTSSKERISYFKNIRVKNLNFYILTFFILIGLVFIFVEYQIVDWNSANILSNKGTYFLQPLISFFYGSIAFLIYIILFNKNISKKKKVFFVTLLLLIPLGLLLIRESKAQAFRPIFFTFIWLSILFYEKKFKIFIFFLPSLPILYYLVFRLFRSLKGSSICAVDGNQFIEQLALFFQCNFSRFYGFDMIVGIFSYIENKSILFGETFLEIFYFWIPRAFWNEKPLTITHKLGYDLQPFLNHTHEGGFVAPSLLGEFILNFSYLGIIFYIVLMTFILLFASKLINRNHFCRFLFPIFIFHIIFTLHGGLAPHAAMTLADMIPYALVFFLVVKKPKIMSYDSRQ